jgi:hypothetical protein
MRTTGNRQQGFAAVAIILILGAYTEGSAQAATCKDELDRFERRLNSSTLARTDTDAFKELVRQAEEASELRDEDECLQTVALLDEALPEDPGAQSGRRAPATRNDVAGANARRANAARPAAPILMIAGGDEADESGEDQETASDRSAGDEDENSLDD